MPRQLASPRGMQQIRLIAAGGAGGRHRLRNRIRQPRPRAGTSGNLRPLDPRCRTVSRRSAQERARRARHVLWRYAAPIFRSVSAGGRRGGAAGDFHPWRLVAVARSFLLQPCGARPECAGSRCRGRGLRSLPEQFRIADIIEQMRRACAFLWQRFGRRMLVYGHSAGGHLSAAMVATDWVSLYPKAPADLIPAGYSISGVFDLAPLVGISVNQDLRLDAAKARALSPVFWPVQPGRIFDAVVGGLELSEFKRQSRLIAQTWQQAGAQTRYEEIAGTNHFTVIELLADPQSAMTARVAAIGAANQALSSFRPRPREEHAGGRSKDQARSRPDRLRWGARRGSGSRRRRRSRDCQGRRARPS